MDVEGELSHSLTDVFGAFRVKVPGGMVWDDAGALLYLVDSCAGTIMAFRCDEQGTPLGADDGDVTVGSMWGLMRCRQCSAVGWALVACGRWLLPGHAW